MFACLLAVSLALPTSDKSESHGDGTDLNRAASGYSYSHGGLGGYGGYYGGLGGAYN